jgi:hypothetical protein
MKGFVPDIEDLAVKNVVHHIRQDAEADNEHFDGNTTE